MDALTNVRTYLMELVTQGLISSDVFKPIAKSDDLEDLLGSDVMALVDELLAKLLEPRPEPKPAKQVTKRHTADVRPAPTKAERFGLGERFEPYDIATLKKAHSTTTLRDLIDTKIATAAEADQRRDPDRYRTLDEYRAARWASRDGAVLMTARRWPQSEVALSQIEKVSARVPEVIDEALTILTRWQV